MAKNRDKSEESPEVAEEQVAGLGEHITRARKAKGLSVGDAATELRLEVSVVEALENDDFSALGAPVFVKGHLRTYERMLGLAADTLVLIYEAQVPDAEGWQAVAIKQDKTKSANLPQLGFIALLVAAFIGLGLFLFGGDKKAPVTPAESDGQSAVQESIVPANDPPASPIDVLPDAPVVADESVSPDAAEAVSVAQEELVLVFRRNCWTEVSDANGRLLFGEQKRGTTFTLVGEFPFTVLLGDARAVDVELNGKSFTIPGSAMRGRKAEFEISGP